MQRSRSDGALLRAVDEKRPLLPVQGDPNSSSPDRLSLASSASSTNFKNPDDSNKYDGQNSRQASFVDKETKYSSMKRKPFHYNTLKDPLETSHDQEMAVLVCLLYVLDHSKSHSSAQSFSYFSQRRRKQTKQSDHNLFHLEYYDGDFIIEHTMGHSAGWFCSWLNSYDPDGWDLSLQLLFDSKIC